MTDKEIEENCRQITRALSQWVDPPSQDQRRTLERFCRIVAELEAHKIFSDLLEPGRIDWRFRIEDGNVVSAHIERLDETELKAFVPLARLFTQKREDASIRKVAAIFDERVSQRHRIWWTFNAYRVRLQQFLSLTAPHQSETFKEIFDVFINGHYIHREDEKEARYESWTKEIDTFTSRKVAFLLAIGSIVSTVRSMRDSAKQLLEVTANPPARQLTKRVPNLPAGLTTSIFADEVVSLDVTVQPGLGDGDRVMVPEALISHVLDFLGDDLAPHILGGHIAEIRLHEYGTKMGNEWQDKRSGASLVFPVAWTSIEKSPNLTVVKKHRGKPAVFVTQEFFSHLHRVVGSTHEWELVL